MKRALGALLFVSLAFAAKPPWAQKAPEVWTAAEAERVLFDSPWAQTADAIFPDPRVHDAIPAQALPGAAQAGLAGPRGATDGKWDGGVGYNNGAGLPTLHVLVRWDSSVVIRQARSRLSSLGKAPEVNFPEMPAGPSDYVLTVVGLVPAKNVDGTAKLDSQSNSDDTPAPAPNPERLLEDFMSNSTLANRAGQLVRPRNVQVDAASGAVRLYFSRTLAFDIKDKEAYFSTRYGSLLVKKRFRLSDLLYQGRLAL